MSTINARCESVREKPTFRESFERRRCLVPATDWYEWAKAGTRKQPISHTVEAHPMAFADILNQSSLDGRPSMLSFTIATTDAAPIVAQFHHRMPVVLEEGEFDQWMLRTPDEGGGLDASVSGSDGPVGRFRLVSTARRTTTPI